MPTPFSRTTRALAADGFGRLGAAVAVGVVLLVGWLLWFWLAPLQVRKTSAHARIEVERAIQPIEAPVAGIVVASVLAIDRKTAAGEVLVELDSTVEKLALAEARSRLAALGPQLETVRSELAAAGRGVGERRSAGAAGQAEARARVREAEIAARHSEDEARQAEALAARGHDSPAMAARTRADAERLRAAASAAAEELKRRSWDSRSETTDREMEIERLRRLAAMLEGNMGTERASIARLEHEVERRRVRSPIAGQVAEARHLPAGAHVKEGDVLGVVLPPGRLRVVADFAPEDALGRIRPGQTARLRLDGFAWMQYGSLGATVTRVAAESRDGRIRVELAVADADGARLPLQHGLPGSIEVTIEEVSPMTLVLRAAGHQLTSRGR